MTEAPKKARPQFTNINAFRDLPSYRLPLAGVVSFLHRVSGFLLFLLLPFVLYLLDKSLTSETTFEHFKGIASMWYVKLILLALVWGYVQHFCSGIRHLFMDAHVALDKDSARRTSVAVLAISAVFTLLVALKLIGVF